MFVSRIENPAGESSVTSGQERDPAEKYWPRIAMTFAILVCLAHLLSLAYFAHQHPFGTYATETDFYQLFAPDAERIGSGQFPQNTFQGPGYPAAIALIAKLTGKSRDLFTVGKWFSIVCAVFCGFLVFILFSRLFNVMTGLG